MKCVYILSFAQAGQDDSNVTEQGGMGTNRIRVAGQGRRSGSNGGRQSLAWFVEAVRWIGRTGCPWRDLPKKFGRWYTVYMRCSRRRRKGVWERVAHVVSDETEIKRVAIDSAIVRAHPHSAGARRKAARKPSAVRAADRRPRFISLSMKPASSAKDRHRAAGCRYFLRTRIGRACARAR